MVAKSTIIAHTVLLGLVLLIDIPVTGIAANLLMVFRGDHFPNSDISSKMRLIMFTSVWTMLFSLIILASLWLASARARFGPLLTWVILFVTFLLWIVSAGSYQTAYSNSTCTSEGWGQCSLFHALQGLVWVNAWIVLGDFIAATVYMFHARQEDKEAAAAAKKEQA